MSTSLHGSVIETVQGKKGKNQRWSYQMLQHDEAKAYIQTRMQISCQVRKAGHLKRKSANE